MQFLEWADKYGPIFHLRIGSQYIFVLNTAEANEELLVARSQSFSSRFAPHIAFDIVSAGQRMVFMPYDKVWKVLYWFAGHCSEMP